MYDTSALITSHGMAQTTQEPETPKAPEPAPEPASTEREAPSPSVDTEQMKAELESLRKTAAELREKEAALREKEAAREQKKLQKRAMPIRDTLESLREQYGDSYPSAWHDTDDTAQRLARNERKKEKATFLARVLADVNAHKEREQELKKQLDSAVKSATAAQEKIAYQRSQLQKLKGEKRPASNTQTLAYNEDTGSPAVPEPKRQCKPTDARSLVRAAFGLE